MADVYLTRCECCGKAGCLVGNMGRQKTAELAEQNTRLRSECLDASRWFDADHPMRKRLEDALASTAPPGESR